MNNKFILDSFTWSFSRINAYEQCPRMFKMTYIDCLGQEENTFAQFGTFGHSLLEQYFNNKLEFFELSQIYEEKYRDNVKLKFPPNAYVNLNETYYKAGREYFDNFEGFYNDCEVLGIEEEIRIKIGEYDFLGYIDLILKSKDGIIIVDHKSKSKFKSKKEKRDYLRQLYLYSIYVYEKFGEYPIKLIFNMFRNNTIIEEPFNIEALEEAKKWCLDSIAKIYNDTEFATKSDDFFCNWLCSTRSNCICSDKYLGE